MDRTAKNLRIQRWQQKRPELPDSDSIRTQVERGHVEAKWLPRGRERLLLVFLGLAAVISTTSTSRQEEEARRVLCHAARSQEQQCITSTLLVDEAILIIIVLILVFLQ